MILVIFIMISMIIVSFQFANSGIIQVILYNSIKMRCVQFNSIQRLLGGITCLKPLV